MRLDEMGSWALAIAIPLALVAGAVPVLTLLQAVTHEEPTMERMSTWTAELERVDEALTSNDVPGAIHAWRNAYTAAIGSRRWDAMLDVGYVYLRIGERTKIRRVHEAKAREAFLVALFRARRESSLDGVLRTGQAFAGLGDREVVIHCIRIAEGIAAQRDPATRELVQQWAERLTTRAMAATEQELP